VPIGLFFLWMSWKDVPDTEAAAPDQRLPWRRLVLLGAGVMAVGLAGQFKEQVLISGLLLVSSIFLIWGTFKLDNAADPRLFPRKALSLLTPVGLSYWCYFFISAGHSSLLVFTPLFLQELHDVTPLYIGYLSLVFSIAWTLGALSVAALTGVYERAAAVGGMVLASLATIGFTVAVLTGPQLFIGIMVGIIGYGIGATNVLMTSYGMAVPREGEEAVTVSAMPTIRSLGIAFGAAAAGLIANSVGLEENVSRETVASVALWVLGATAIIPALGALVTLRAVTWGWSYRKGQ
jgi:predicted MFS family arabinose efflux permease